MRIVDFIVCEDIREEIDSKHSLMGVHYGSFQLRDQRPKSMQNTPPFPYAMQLAIFVRCYFDEGEPRPDQFVLKIEQDHGEPLEVKSSIQEQGPPRPFFHLKVKFDRFVFYDVGTLRFELELRSHEQPIECPLGAHPNMKFQVTLVDE